METEERTLRLAKPVKKGIGHLLFSRFGLIALLLVVQIGAVLSVYLHFSEAGAGADGHSLGVCEAVYMDILNRATDYVHIMTPYLILDGELEAALQFAALRGVDVRLILPGIPDKKIAYALAKTHYRSLHRPLGKEKLSMKIIGAAAKSLAPLM